MLSAQIERQREGVVLADQVEALFAPHAGSVAHFSLPEGSLATMLEQGERWVKIRSGSAEGGEIPFFAPLIGHAGVQAPFLDGRGRVGLAASAESARPTDRSAIGEAPAFGRLSLDARYAITGPLAVVLRGERLVGEAERWPGFPEPPFTVMLGLRLAR